MVDAVSWKRATMGSGGSGSNVGDTYGSHDDGTVGGGIERAAGEENGAVGKESEVSEARNSLPPDDSQLKHMFRDDDGHLPDTPGNRELIQELANDESCLLGTDQWGNEWYARVNEDGTQTWASVQNGTIQNCGENDAPIPFDPVTGLCANKPKSNGFTGRKG